MTYIVLYPSPSGDRQFAHVSKTLNGARAFATRLQSPTKGGKRRKPRKPRDPATIEIRGLGHTFDLVGTPTPRRGGPEKPPLYIGMLQETLADGERIPPAAVLRKQYRRKDVDGVLSLARSYPASCGFRLVDPANPRSPLVRDASLGA